MRGVEEHIDRLDVGQAIFVTRQNDNQVLPLFKLEIDRKRQRANALSPALVEELLVAMEDENILQSRVIRPPAGENSLRLPNQSCATA